MMEFNQVEISDGIDEKKVARMIKWLIATESENCKTNNYNDSEMIFKIAKQIQSDVKCL